jgi:hypothetical protein
MSIRILVISPEKSSGKDADKVFIDDENSVDYTKFLALF